jgi:hypothetical protein
LFKNNFSIPWKYFFIRHIKLSLLISNYIYATWIWNIFSSRQRDSLSSIVSSDLIKFDAPSKSFVVDTFDIASTYTREWNWEILYQGKFCVINHVKCTETDDRRKIIFKEHAQWDIFTVFFYALFVYWMKQFLLVDFHSSFCFGIDIFTLDTIGCVCNK